MDSHPKGSFFPSFPRLSRLRTCGILPNIRSAMRTVLLSLAAILAAVTISPAQIAYESDGWIYLSSEGGKPKKLVQGVYPAFSPDGKSIAYNTEEEDGSRHIAIYDLSSAKSSVIPNIPSDNCFGPSGHRMAKRSPFRFSMTTTGTSASSGRMARGFFRLPLQKEVWSPPGRPMVSPSLPMTWMPSTSLPRRQDPQTWPVGLFGSGASMSSGSTLAVSPDGKSLLIEVDGDEDVKIKDWDGPPPALWTIDLQTEARQRIGSHSLLAWSGCWESANRIICNGATRKSPSPRSIASRCPTERFPLSFPTPRAHGGSGALAGDRG